MFQSPSVFWERRDEPQGVGRPDAPSPMPVWTCLGTAMAKATPPVVAGDREIVFCLRHVARGNFKEFYRCAVPQVDGEHVATLINSTWAGCGPDELEGKRVVVRVQGGEITHWKFADEDEWNEYDEE